MRWIYRIYSNTIQNLLHNSSHKSEYLTKIPTYKCWNACYSYRNHVFSGLKDTLFPGAKEQLIFYFLYIKPF